MNCTQADILQAILSQLTVNHLGAKYKNNLLDLEQIFAPYRNAEQITQPIIYPLVKK